MMNTVSADFEKRAKEIEIYFRHLEAIEEKNGKLSVATARGRTLRKVDPVLVKVLKSNLFLLLYNLVESSVRQSLVEVFDAISAEKMMYSEASDHIKKLWIQEGHQKFKNNSAEQIFNSLTSLANDIVEIEFGNGVIMGGNIDGRKIRDFSETYGFSSTVHKNAKNGVKLHEVKRHRNDLAHGLVSFSECGRNYTVSDLRQTKHEVVLYLRGILRNISRYLDSKAFRIDIREES
ncbi:MAE_28990/MAE_18760 family HEPN-like nuclease [Rubritalea spongiae]|uniref:MAE_28990/MAE_18760 family HEPN-like nuclease n=1 Tax=Rubritalea spongiae TaxID=430797 RepID=A0ABW5E858_9BACT